jgi:hypothetical protein
VTGFETRVARLTATVWLSVEFETGLPRAYLVRLRILA